MGGFFGVASQQDCVFDLFFGTDYHSHLGTRRGGMAVLGEEGFNRAIHNIENSPFRTKFDSDIQEMKGNLGIGIILTRSFDDLPNIIIHCRKHTVVVQNILLESKVHPAKAVGSSETDASVEHE